MSQELWTKDWKRINEMILRMNSESDILKALNTFLTDIEGLVPYEKACIYFYDLSAPEIVKDYIGQGFSEKELIDYERYYCNIDDVVEKMMPNKEVVIKSSEAFDINKRKETEYFIDYVTPAKTKVSLDTNFRWNMENRGFCIGSLDLFRNEKDVDFSESRDLPDIPASHRAEGFQLCVPFREPHSQVFTDQCRTGCGYHDTQGIFQ